MFSRVPPSRCIRAYIPLMDSIWSRVPTCNWTKALVLSSCIASSVIFRGNLSVQGGTPSKLLLLYLGSQAFYLQAPFDGAVVAPNAYVGLSTVGSRGHSGSFFATSIEVFPDTVVTLRPFDWSFVQNALSSCAVQPVARCVEQDSSGQLYGHFGFTNASPAMGVVLPVGPFNRFSVAPEFRSQPNQFFAKGITDAFRVALNGGSVTWILGGRTATANPGMSRCQ